MTEQTIIEFMRESRGEAYPDIGESVEEVHEIDGPEDLGESWLSIFKRWFCCCLT